MSETRIFVLPQKANCLAFVRIRMGAEKYYIFVIKNILRGRILAEFEYGVASTYDAEICSISKQLVTCDRILTGISSVPLHM